MGIFANIFEKRGFLKANDPRAFLPFFGGNDTIAGPRINEETALSASAVWCAVVFLSSVIGALPLHVYSRNGRNKKRAKSLKLYKILHNQANAEMTAMIAREMMIISELLYGYSYTIISRDGQGQIIALWPVHPSRVSVDRNNKKDLIYEVSVENGTRIYRSDEMLRIQGAGGGRSLMELAKESLGLTLAMEEYAARYFGSGTHPGVIVSHPGKLSPQESHNIQRSLTNRYSDLGNAHKLMVLEEDMKIHELGNTPENSQCLESRGFSVTEVARWFNLPPHILKDLSHATFSNIESQSLELVKYSIGPRLVRYEQSFNAFLLTDSQKRIFFCEHDTNGLLRGDVEARFRAYRIGREMGLYSPNDIAELENRNQIPASQGGDTYIIPANYMPAGMIGDQAEPEPDEDPPEPGEPDIDELRDFFSTEDDFFFES